MSFVCRPIQMHKVFQPVLYSSALLSSPSCPDRTACDTDRRCLLPTLCSDLTARRQFSHLRTEPRRQCRCYSVQLPPRRQIDFMWQCMESCEWAPEQNLVGLDLARNSTITPIQKTSVLLCITQFWLIIIIPLYPYLNLFVISAPCLHPWLYCLLLFISS